MACIVRAMASPLQSRKPSVNLAAPAVRISRIRRDPPPVVKELTAADVKEQDARSVTVGILAFGLAIFVVLIAAGNATGWSPTNYSITISEHS
jgi:hypothetical protein